MFGGRSLRTNATELTVAGIPQSSGAGPPTESKRPPAERAGLGAPGENCVELELYIVCSSGDDGSVDRIESPQNQRSRDTRAAVLDAAWELLEHSGGAAVTMSAVARAAGISRRGLYLHFPSRGQLFMELLAHVDDELDLESSLRPIREAPDSLAALDAFADHVAGYHSKLVAVAGAVDRCRAEDEDAAALWEQAMGNWYGGCCALAARLAAEGRLAEPWTERTAADLMWALMSLDFVDDLVGERGWSTDELTDRLRVLLHRTLCGSTA